MALATFGAWQAAILKGFDRVIDSKEIAFYGDAEQGKYENGRPPAINFRFVDDSYGPPRSARRGGVGNDPIWSCATRIGVHIWGADAEQVHEIRRRIIVALHNVSGHGNYRLEPGAWNTGGVNDKGSVYVF